MVIFYLIIGLIVSGFWAHRGIARILNYMDGKAISVYGTSEEDARKRATEFMKRAQDFKNGSREKFAGVLVAGFIVGVVAWFVPVVMYIVHRHHVNIQNGEILP